ncbi:SsgA family sporulation/cell division regulator [Pseudonocardia sp. NPDC049635]|uniref:SsgA family sporulation/cell division regulator n=1 Tax=Pseudonocardia sp. NPDC049635 TaxID=3155506 RepID=UPI0033FBE6FE
MNLTYRRTNPFEITADFPNSAGDFAVTWCIGRETLSAGLTATAEMSYEADRLVSDIQIGTHALRWHDWTLLTLSSPSGTAEIGLPTYELIQFVARTEDIVPAGTEAELITDAHLAELFEV